MGKMGKRLKRGTKVVAAPSAQVSLLVTPWDLGPNTAAQRAGKVIEECGVVDPANGKLSNPNGVLRARRVDVLETYHRRGWLDARQFNVAEKLRNAWENTQRGPAPKLGQKVDSSPNPDHAVTIQMDQIGDFILIMGRVPKADKQIIGRCVLDGATPASLPQFRGARLGAGVAALRDALDRLATAIGS